MRYIIAFGTNQVLGNSRSGYCIGNSGASAVTFSIPDDVSSSHPIGSEMEICRLDTGTLTVDGMADVTLYCPDQSAPYSISAQYKSAYVKKIAANTWIIRMI